MIGEKARWARSRIFESVGPSRLLGKLKCPVTFAASRVLVIFIQILATALELASTVIVE